MDKYEYKLKTDQMKALAAEGDYETAAEIADSINWHRVKNVNLLIRAGDIYTKLMRYDEAWEILHIAYERSSIGRMTIYRLAELAILMQNIEEAEEYYDEFVEIAPKDSLKYVLRYKLSKAKGSGIKTQITILEELKEREWSEEWVYELAYLYHKAGESEKCIETCDELILWFGDGIYVERALELKMFYQPLTKSQKDKYRTFKRRRDGVKEVYPYEEISSIPVPKESGEKFDTAELQNKLAQNMQLIMDATEKETVEDTMDNIKKIVEDIPYLKINHEEDRTEADGAYRKAEEAIDKSIHSNYTKMLKGTETEDSGIQGQTELQDGLSGWEKASRAAQTALYLAEQQQLETVKAKALHETREIMDRLIEVIPKLDAGITPRQLMQEEYLAEGDISDEERAGRYMAGMNDMLQQQIEKLQEEAEEGEHELLRKIKRAKPEYKERRQILPESYIERLPQGRASEENDILEEHFLQAEEEDKLEQPGDAYEETAEMGAEQLYEGTGEFTAEMNETDLYEGAGEFTAEADALYEESGDSEAEAELYEGVDAFIAEADEPELYEEGGVSDTETADAEPYGEIGESVIEADLAGAEEELKTSGREILQSETEEELGELTEEQEEALAEEMRLAEAEFFGISAPPDGPQNFQEDIPSSIPVKQDTKEIQTREIEEALKQQGAEHEHTEKTDPVPRKDKVITKLNKEQKAIFSYFVPVAGMEGQICKVLTDTVKHFQSSESSATGHILIQGGIGCGKTVFATALIKALRREVKRPKGKVGRIDAASLNKKDLSGLLKKVAGGYLVIERAGEINRETAVKLSLLLDTDNTGLLVIMEDTRVGLNQALSRDEGLAKKFTEKVVIPVFTSDELVEFGKAYAHDLDYEIDTMGVLALYNRISNIQRLDRATTLTEVKEIIDEAIGRAEKKTIKKAFSIITSRRYTKDAYVILREKDFEE